MKTDDATSASDAVLCYVAHKMGPDVLESWHNPLSRGRERRATESVLTTEVLTFRLVPGKLFAMNLLDRWTSILQRKRIVQQTLLIPGRSTVRLIFTMPKLIQKTKEFERKAYVTLVNFKAAND